MPENRPYSRIEVMWGYTVGDIDVLAGTAVRHARKVTTDTFRWHDFAWAEVAYALTQATSQPHRNKLIQYAYQGIMTEFEQILRCQGTSYRNRHLPNAGARSLVYWEEILRGEYLGHEEHPSVEKIAVAQLVTLLDDFETETLMALAASESYTQAAERLGISLPAFSLRMTKVKRKLWPHWYHPQTPPKPRRDRRTPRSPRGIMCSKGLHEMVGENCVWQRTAGGRKGRFVCRQCRIDHAKAYRAKRKNGS